MNADSVELLEMFFPEGVLRYELHWTKRRRTLCIVVEPDRRVVVLAPRYANLERVAALLSRRIRWIRKQWLRIDALPPRSLPRQWVGGETHCYLGRQYRLKLRKDESESVRMLGGFFVVSVSDLSNTSRIRELMDSWYQERAEALLLARVTRAIEATSWLQSRIPEIRIGRLKSRWGSTSSAGRITFNVDLVKAPLACVEYVVAHELVHLRIPNHSPAFWWMLSRVMPDWKRWRDRLRNVEM